MRRPQPPIKPFDPVRDRFVYDTSLIETGGALASAPVIERDDHKIVRLSDSAAEFYLTQGSIGNTPMDELKEKPAAVAAQMIGEQPEPPVRAAPKK